MNKNILIAPLNWGLGHATRCIPIINALLKHDFTPIIASDGAALALLTKEFPDLEALELPSYNISYAKKGYYLKFKLLMDTPRILKTIRAEQIATELIVKTHHLAGIISDNRFGVYSKDLPSVYITHQLNVLSGNTTWLSTKIHHKTIQRYNECWVPDTLEKPYLSGKMGHIDNCRLNIKFIGPLSRFQKSTSDFQYDIMVLLSGPEPQRGILEEKLLTAFINYKGQVLFVKGIIEKEQTVKKSGNLTIYNFMTSKLLEKSLNSSELIVARSGYTTIMDLSKLGKKAFFIPTPGQFEQEYLAKQLTADKLADSCDQNAFSLEKLTTSSQFKGLETLEHETDFKELFKLFQSK